MLKKLLSIFFLAIFLFNIIGYYPVFLLQQQSIRNGISSLMEQSIHHNSTTIFIFSLQEFSCLKWVKENEFIYNENMYDVMWQESGENDEIILHCINDTKEKKLLADFDKHVDMHMKNEGKTTDNQKKTIKNPVKDFMLYINNNEPSFRYINIKFFSTGSHYFSVSRETISPPPWSA